MSAIWRNSGACVFLLGALVIGWCMASFAVAQPAGVEMVSVTAGEPVAKVLPVSVDSTTGFAIEGLDPVSYFVEDKPSIGTGHFEARWHDVAWRFANPGNQQAFIDNPEIYAPRFGGFSVVSLARGQLVESDPWVFVLHRGRLYLFFSKQQAFVFARDPDDLIAKAELAWREINKLPEPVPEPEPEEKAVPVDQPGVPIFD